jgi:lipoate-protein ligase A
MRKVNDKLVYHAVLNLSEDTSVFAKYLRHPVREPDYRAGRSHNEFVTSLANEGYTFTAEKVMSMLNRKLGGIMDIIESRPEIIS